MGVIMLVVIGAAFLYFFMFVMSLLDDIWIALFHKPLYIHLYLKPKKISPEEAFFLRQKFPFYKKLSEKHKVYFHHRLASFKETYQFIPRQDFVINQEVQTLIAGTYVMLTFGMRRYLIDSFDKIIIYPEEYYSNHTEEYHKGEFNPKMKAVVFSWKDFTAGYEIENDNLNLGIHEFSHVVHLHSLRSNDGSSLAFRKHYKRLHKEVNHPPNRQRLIDSDYFRIYAFTNQFEFISVIIEHYFETPDEFRIQFPELFNHVSKMLNHKH
ncbi:zinc-dependent peptidase [Flavobacterium sp. J49]|uniref:zinc-dependent peptidase n=2 Tax=Flavobacterium sp. J49 TaxID=2718534 RepID=UPI001593F25C|nr:zinc-dependent peptidase [Flavobacterium sp. J49]NIC01813.1 zinc-dependent peptidase [Flavobacterium sp. J49]